MKIFLSFLLLVVGIQVQAANQCFNLFGKDQIIDSSRGIPRLRSVSFQSMSGQDILINLFQMIYDAPLGAKVQIYTPNLNYDGVFSLLNMVAVKRASPGQREKGITFDITIGNPNVSQTVLKLLTELSTNEVYLLKGGLRTPKEGMDSFFGAERDWTHESFVRVIDSNGKTISYLNFDGAITTESLKDYREDRSNRVKYFLTREKERVSYNGLRFITASPFRDIIEGSLYLVMDVANKDHINYRSIDLRGHDLLKFQSGLDIQNLILGQKINVFATSSTRDLEIGRDKVFASTKNRITEEEVRFLNRNANDLAIQLANGFLPKEEMDYLQLIEATVK